MRARSGDFPSVPMGRALRPRLGGHGHRALEDARAHAGQGVFVQLSAQRPGHSARGLLHGVLRVVTCILCHGVCCFVIYYCILKMLSMNSRCIKIHTQ